MNNIGVNLIIQSNPRPTQNPCNGQVCTVHSAPKIYKDNFKIGRAHV